MIIVALRGSVILADWVINLNHGLENTVEGVSWFPLTPELLANPTQSALGDNLGSAETQPLTRIHPGLHVVAETMESRLRPRLIELLAAEPATQTVLFTGHSAGGAVAQFLYRSALSDDLGGRCYPSLLWLYELKVFLVNIKVDCITFGAPPIANPPIDPRANSLFISVINEGDPVPLIEPDYAYTLLKAYVSAPPTNYPRLPIPPRMFALSGTCVVLRASSRLNPKQKDIIAYIAKNEHFAEVLFGNFVMHKMSKYLERVSKIAG